MMRVRVSLSCRNSVMSVVGSCGTTPLSTLKVDNSWSVRRKDRHSRWGTHLMMMSTLRVMTMTIEESWMSKPVNVSSSKSICGSWMPYLLTSSMRSSA